LRPSVEYHQYWYPNFITEAAACLKDGEQPFYMRDTATGWLSESAKDCCKDHFQWDIATCRMNSLGGRKFYPSFDFEAGGCKNDGLEPLYMKRYDGYLFDTPEECCENYFNFGPLSLAECIDPSDVDPCSPFMESYDGDYLLDSERGCYPACEYKSTQNSLNYCHWKILLIAYLYLSILHFQMRVMTFLV